MVQITKVSGQKIETTDQKTHNFQFTKIGKKRIAKMTTIDFISIEANKTLKTMQK